MKLPRLMTEAVAHDPLTVTYRDRSESSVRTLPYEELYHDRSGVIESPAERLQRAARDQQQISRPHGGASQ